MDKKLTKQELTDLYNSANGIDPKKHVPITTERIFTAMQAAFDAGKEKRAPRTPQEKGYITGTLKSRITDYGRARFEQDGKTADLLMQEIMSFVEKLADGEI